MNQLFRGWIDRYFSNPQVLILGLLLVVGAALILFLGRMLAPVLAAVLIAYLLEGVVGLLQRHRVPRKVAVLVVFVLFVLGLLTLLFIMLPVLYRQIGQLLQQLPAMFTKGQNLLMQLPEKYPNIITEPQIRQIIGAISNQITGFAQSLLSFSLASVRSLIAVVVYLILVPLLVFFFLQDKNKIVNWIKSFLPEQRRLAGQVWVEVNHQFANYIRGKIMEILIIGTISYIVFFWMGIDFAELLALLTGLSVLVPYIGVTVVAFPVALIAFFQWGMSAGTAYAILAYGIIQLFDGNLLAPLLLSRVVNLHPVAIIVAVLIFGGIWGFMGLLFAIPLATLVHAVIKAWIGSLQKELPPAATDPQPAEEG